MCSKPITVKKRTVHSLDIICDPFRTIKPLSHQSHQLKKKAKDRAARFMQDSRLEDVAKMLNYTYPRVCKLPGDVAITWVTRSPVRRRADETFEQGRSAAGSAAEVPPCACCADFGDSDWQWCFHVSCTCATSLRQHTNTESRALCSAPTISRYHSDLARDCFAGRKDLAVLPLWRVGRSEHRLGAR